MQDILNETAGAQAATALAGLRSVGRRALMQAGSSPAPTRSECGVTFIDITFFVTLLSFCSAARLHRLYAGHAGDAWHVGPGYGDHGGGHPPAGSRGGPTSPMTKRPRQVGWVKGVTHGLMIPLHEVAALVTIAGFIIHVYRSVFMVPSSTTAITSGWVSIIVCGTSE
jgi:hypothetical protein